MTILYIGGWCSGLGLGGWRSLTFRLCSFCFVLIWTTLLSFQYWWLFFSCTMYCDVSFVEDPLENERVHLKGFILSTFEITKYIKFIGKYIKHAGLGCIWNMCCQLFSWWARVSPECASSYLSSTKLRPLTQPTSQTCAPHTYHQKGHTPIVWVKVFQLFLCVKRKNLKVSRKKTLESGEKRGAREEALSGDMIHTATYIFLLFPTTDYG